MATTTQGTADLIAALTGGGSLEDAAYMRSANRILDAQNKQSMMDKRVIEANLLRDQMRSRGNFERNSQDMPEDARFAILAGMGSDFNQGQKGIGQSQANEAQAQALQIVETLKNEGADPIDVMNLLTGAGTGKLLGPGNVDVAGQAQADKQNSLAQAFQAATAGGKNQAQTSKINAEIPLIEPQGLATRQKTQAEIAAANALTQQRQASAEKYRSETGVDGVPALDPKGLNTAQLGMLSEVPITTSEMVDPWYAGPRMETTTEPTDMAFEFYRWQAEKAKTNRDYLNADFAMAEFIKEQMSGAPTPGSQGVGKNRRLIYDPTTQGFHEVGGTQ